jgi:Cu2+-exporting ATPase
MAFITLTVLGIASGLLYARKTVKAGGKSPLKQITTKLLQAKSHQKSLKNYLAESSNKQQDELALVEKNELKKNLTIFAGSSALAITGTLFFPPLALLSIPGALYLVKDVYINTAKAVIGGGKLNVHHLVAVFMTCMLYQGYFIASHFFISLYLLNRQLVKRAKQVSKRNIIDVFRDQPRTAWVLIDGVEIEMPIGDVQENATVVVSAGESIPVDGNVLEGFATVDQHLLTGESQPTEKAIGDQVFACTVVLTGKVFVQVEKTGEETASAKIGQILNNTVDVKTSKQLWAEKFTDQTVGPILGLSAIALATVGPTSALIVLNSHFRYRLTLATSTCVLTYLSLGAQRGLLLKSGLILDEMQSIDTVVFDKTGTLTLDTPHVIDISAYGEWTEESVLAIAASVEARQSHPIAKAICKQAEQENLTIEEASDANYQIGYGLVAAVKDQQVQVGSLRYAREQGLQIPDAMIEKEAACHEMGQSLVVVCVNKQVAGAIELQATVRPESASVIQSLRDLGLSLHIISGDHPAPTKALADSLQIENYHAEVLPEDKAEIIKQLQAEGRSVCYIGDGINDAIALQEANVSVSIRGASSVATDTAEVILMDQDLNRLCDLFQLAKEYDQNVKTTSRMVTVPSFMNLSLVLVPQAGVAASIGVSILSVLASFGTSMWPLIKHQKMEEEPLNIKILEDIDVVEEALENKAA